MDSPGFPLPNRLGIIRIGQVNFRRGVDPCDTDSYREHTSTGTFQIQSTIMQHAYTRASSAALEKNISFDNSGHR